MNDGWIKLHRSFLDWEWYTCPNTCRLFLYCMIRANHTATKWRGEDINRGEFLTSYEKLSAGTGLSVQSVRTSIKNLESTGEITRKSTRKLTKLTVCNYGTYNNSDSQPNKQTNSKLTSNQQGSNREVTTDKKEKNNKNEEEFNIFWKAYPKKVMKGNAEKTFKKLVKQIPLNVLLDGISKSPQLNISDKQFMPNAQAWLNGRGWEDETVRQLSLDDKLREYKR